AGAGAGGVLRSELGDAGDAVHRLCVCRPDLFRVLLCDVALRALHRAAFLYWARALKGRGVMDDTAKPVVASRAPATVPAMRTTKNEIAVDVISLSKWYGEFQVLREVSLRVTRGERIVICGPSGGGKSTLLRCINRIENWQRGRLIVDGVELTEDLKKIEE